MKIKLLIYFCFGILLLGGCTRPLNMNTVADEPHFTGLVSEVYENSILVQVREGQEVRNSSDLMEVSLNTEIKDSMTAFEVGDEVCVYYNGTIVESYPAQISKVYAITLVQPVGREIDFSDISTGMSREEIHELFGEPSGFLSGFYGDIYNSTDSSTIFIYYDGDGKVTEIKVDIDLENK